MGDTNTTNEQIKLISLDNLETYTGYVERKGIDITYEDYQKLTPEEKANKTYYVTDYESGGSADAHDISYDNEDSGLTATDVQAAIDEVSATVDTLPTSDTTYTLSAGEGADAQKVVLTPSSGNAQKVTAPYATDAGTVNGKTVESNVPANAVFTDTTYTAATSAPGDIASAGSVGTSTDYARQDHTHGITVAQGDNNGQVKIAGQNVAVKGLGSAAFTATTDYIASSTKGANNGVAELDANGKVPSSQLPSYVDDVIEGYLYNGHFYEEAAHTTEITGETGKIYVDLSTEKTYRWSGTAFVEISESLALGETSSTAYAGDKGKANADAITAIKDGTTIDSFGDVESAISTLQSNFQDGVDDVYDAIVAKGTTPASKSLSDVVAGVGQIETIHTTTYKPTSRASNVDMGQTHSYRYVNTTEVPNTNAATYDVTSNGIKDMGATNDKRYVNVSVPNTNTGTYTFAANDTGGIKDMGATNDKRYVVATAVYDKGKADGKADHSTTYTPTSRASNNDMGQTHSYRYVNTNSVPNSNSGTYDITSNGVKDMGATNDKRYANVSVPNSNSGTYTPTTKSTFDMGATNDKRYVDTRSVANVNSGTYGSVTSNGVKDMGADNTYRYCNINVPNSNSGTASYDSNGVKDMGAANSYRYVNINVPHPTHTTTYTPTTRASNCDMGSVHSYRYVNTNSVPNSNSGTYTPAGNAIYDMGATNDKRYCDGRTAYSAGYSAKRAELTNTYTPTSRASNLDMGSNHSYRYVNTNSVPNSNSGTYGSVTSNGVKDMGATNSYRYCNINVPNSNSGTYTYASGSTGGTVDMGSTNSYRYVNASNVYAKGKADGKGEVSTSLTYVGGFGAAGNSYVKDLATGDYLFTYYCTGGSTQQSEKFILLDSNGSTQLDIPIYRGSKINRNSSGYYSMPQGPYIGFFSVSTNNSTFNASATYAGIGYVYKL